MNEDSKDIKSVFAEALEKRTPEERAVYLDKVCGNDADLRAKVEALLKAHDEAGDFLEVPALGRGATLDQPAQIEGPGTMIGRYELLELIGEGGMGLVYLAEQKEPVKRRVAMKIVKLGMDTKQVVARFEAERQTLALLEHPNIAHVFDAGTTDSGRPYFVMEYVKGKSITRYCDEKKLSIEKRLELVQQVCEGVHYAHQKGIIHRDIKPSNILVSIHGDKAVPKIIDFGIAKAITQPLTEKTSYTEQGQLLGTPEYMSPEQAEMAYQDIDTRSDIYSLGVVLYELLAGAPPFDAKRLREGGIDHIQQVICEEEPRTPSARLTSLGDKAKAVAQSRRTQIITLTRRLHRELEWIPMKAMRKDQIRRYRSASELADDIQNYLTGTPLIAGPESAVYRTRKFVRKHAGSVATAALLLVVIVLGLVASILMGCRAEQARKQEAAVRKQVEQALARAEKAEAATREKAEELRRTLYANSIQLADAKYGEGNIRHFRELLDACPDDLRGWEWNRLNYISNQSIMTIRGAQRLVTYAILSPDGKRIVSGSWGRSIKVWDAVSGEELMNISGHEDNVWSVAFSPDGKRLVSGSADKTVKLWDVESGTELMTFRGHDKGVWHVAFSPDGKRIASATYGKIIKIWDAITGVEVTNIQHGGVYVGGVAFSPDGKYIASGNKDKICIWDANSGSEAMAIPAAHKHWVMCVAYSPDGKRIVSCGGWDPTIKVWDAAAGKEIMTLRGHSQWVNCVSYDSRGRFILSGSQDNNINVWDAATGEELMALCGHHGPVRSASFSHDGKMIISGSADKTIKLWDVSTSREQVTLPVGTLAGYFFSISFSPDGKYIASAGPRNKLTIWDTTTGAELMGLCGHKDLVWAGAFSPDGKHIASGSRDGIVKVWDAAKGRELMTIREHRGYDKYIVTLAFSPDGRHIVFAGRDQAIRIYNVTTGVEVMKLQGHKPSTASVVYSPDGSRIISSGGDNTIKVWDAATGTEILTIKGHGGRTNCIAVSHNGKLIASGGKQGMMKIWDAATGSELMTLSGHIGMVGSISFSPDGRRLVSTSRTDGTIKVWDTTTGAELMTLLAGEDTYLVAFSPDGSTIAALCSEGIILWETTKPAGGYRPRQIAKAAREVVDGLYKGHGLYSEVINKLKADETLDKSVRKIALQIANSRLWEDARKLEEQSWELVSSPGGQIEAYRLALGKAEMANRLEPNDRIILYNLGRAQYRAGAYQDALNTLTRAERMWENINQPIIAKFAFIYKAMASHKLGQYEHAEVALQVLLDWRKDERFAEDEEGQAFLEEAEKLLAGEKQ